MDDIIYRPVNKSNYNEIKEIINERIGLHKYFNNPKVLRKV